MVGTLSPDDVTGLQPERSTDADWNSDACTSRSESGMHLELVNPKSVNVFLFAWRSSGQSATSRSTAESEVVALSHGLRHFGLPVLYWCMNSWRAYPLVCLVDNQQTITAVKRGYSKRLRCLNRTHRIAIGSLLMRSSVMRGSELKSGYIESKLQKGNIYAKALVPAQFSAERLLIGMQRPSNHSNN